MKKLAYLITGDSPQILKTHTPYSRKKIQLLGFLVLLPTFVWFINGYLISKELLGNATKESLLVGCICALIVFIIDRSIVISNGGKLIFVFRFLMGFAVAFIGALLIDSILLKNDVDRFLEEKYSVLSEQKKLEKEAEYSDKIVIQDIKVSQAKVLWKELADKYQCEMDGTCGSRKPGHAKIASAKENLMLDAKADYESQFILLNSLKKEQSEEGIKAKNQMLSFAGKKSLMHRIENMHDMIRSSTSSIITYCVFFFIALCIELMVIIIKTATKKSSYELAEEMAENLNTIKLQELERNFLLIAAQNKRYGLKEKDAITALKERSPHLLSSL